MSVDILGTSWDQCWSMVQYSFTSTETRRLVRTDNPGRPPRLSHSSWTMCILRARSLAITVLSVLIWWQASDGNSCSWVARKDTRLQKSDSDPRSVMQCKRLFINIFLRCNPVQDLLPHTHTHTHTNRERVRLRSFCHYALLTFQVWTVTVD